MYVKVIHVETDPRFKLCVNRCTHLQTHPRLWWDGSLGQIWCKSVKVCLFVCWSLTSLCHSNGHIETMPAREINPFTALTRIRSQFLRTKWSPSNHSEWIRLRIKPLSHRGWRKSVKEIWSYHSNNILHCDLEMQVKGRSMSLIFKVIQCYGGMHHWVKFCVNRWMKSEDIALTRFCIAT